MIVNGNFHSMDDAAYFVSGISYENKMFMKPTPNNLEMLSTATHFHPSLTFAGKAGTNENGAPYWTPL